jgi:hypothetical protein
MADDDTRVTGKTIKLNKLKSNEYRLWVVQSEATFEVYKCLKLVLGKEPKPTPSPDDSDDESASVTSWDTRHALAREALLRSLEPSDLIRVITVKDSAPAIWKRLADEYGKSLGFEYIRVNSEFQALRKDSKTSMNDHINKFNNLLQMVDYNRPKEIPELTKASTNLYFLQSLGKDWEIWGMAKGKLIRTQPTAELMAEVRALAMRGNTASQAETATSEQSQEAKVNVSRFDGGSQTRDGNRKWKRNRDGNKGGGKNHGKPYHGKHQGGKNGGNGGKNHGRRASFNPHKFCVTHQAQGHDEFECRKAARDKDGNNGNGNGNNGNGNGNSGSRQSRSESYQPNFTQPFPYSANTINHIVNVTRFIDINSMDTDISHSIGDSDWLVDSAANAYTTPFKSDLRFFIEANIGQVKGFGGKLTTARGKGSMTLTDPAGNRLTLHDVCYVPESQDRILSMMKFRIEQKTSFRFTGLETFEMIATNGFQLSGRSINNILHTSLNSQPEVNVAVTRSLTAAVRNEANRKQITEIPSDSEPEELEENDPDFDADSEPELRIAGAAAHNDDTAIVPLICKPRDLWHLRYGHASTTVLRKLDLIKSTFDSRKCVPCLRAKKTRKPFPPSESKAEAKLERIHSDICGQFPDSEDNTTYNLLFIDEATRWAHSIDLKDKSSATLKEKFTEYIAEVERQTGMKVKKLHVDGGGEYKGQLTPILKSLGIKYEPTPPRTPECNGKAERMNRTLNNMVRAMLAQANMPNSFWASAMKMATYL